jgi:hypothetical protein
MKTCTPYSVVFPWFISAVIATANPIITNQPASQTVPIGSTASFSVTAGGQPPLLFQWRFNNNLVFGATNSTFTITEVQFPNAGPYFVVISDSTGSVTSSVAILTIGTNLPSCPSVLTNGLLPGFDLVALPRSNDNPSVPVTNCFRFCFCGRFYTNVFVNNDGNVTLDRPFGGHRRPPTGPASYEPSVGLADLGFPIFAPFWADVDTGTNGSGTVGWGCSCVLVDGAPCRALGVTWRNVGYFPDIGDRSDKANSFQLLIIERTNQFGASGFDLQYRYETINWDTASSGHGTKGLCVTLPTGDAGGFPARAGYGNGGKCSFELTNSAACNNALLDNGKTALVKGQFNSDVPGVYTWHFTNCVPALNF